MAKEKQAAETQPDAQNGRKPQQVEQQTTSVEAAVLPVEANGAAAANAPTDPKAQVNWLGDRRLGMIQRHAVARQINQQHGNDHLQKIITSLQGNNGTVDKNGKGHPNGNGNGKNHAGAKPAHAAKSTGSVELADQELSEGLGGTGSPAFGAATPPNGNEKNHPVNGSQPHIQRQDEEEDLPTEAEKAAALAAAQRAEAMAGQTAGQAEATTDQSRDKQAAEKQKGEGEQAKAEQAKSERKAGANGKAAEAQAKPPQEASTVANQNGKAAEKAVAVSTGPGAAMSAEQPAGTAGQETGGKAPASPEEDPGFQAVKSSARQAGTAEKSHATASSKAAAAQSAAEMPAAEIDARAQSNQVGNMEAAPAPGFNAAAFKAKLMQKIAEAAPRTTQQADEFKENNKLGAVKGEMQNQAEQERDASKAPMEQATEQAPDTGSIPPKPTTPLSPDQPGETARVPNAEAAAPKPKTQAEVEAPIQENTGKIDQQMAEAEITDEQLAKSNEPDFTKALDAKNEAKAQAETAPGEYRQAEQAELSQAQGDAAATAQEQTQAMHGERAAVLAQVSERQGQTKTQDEQARAKVSADIQAIYNQTKTKVEKILSDLDGKVEATFDEGAAIAKQAFEDYVAARMDAYKERRYGGWFGWARWAKDKIAGMPGEVNVFYQEGRDLFIQKMDAVIDNVVAIIGTGLAEAKAEIANGKKEIQKYLAGLPENLRQVGAQAAEGIQSQFADLEQTVDAKQDELIDTLSNKYQEHLQAVDARIEELKAANQGLVDKAINFVSGVIKVILKLKEMLTTVLSKIASVVSTILRDPIGFLGNLISGIKQGLNSFIGNIITHLQTGLIGWLTGALGPIGIQIPDDIFSLEGIFSLVLQVMGISWAYIRGKAVRLLGEPVVKALETGFEIFKILITEGPAGLWNFVKDQFSGLKEMVMDAIKDMVITEVIKAGVKWILGLLNPAGALIKAAMAIYDIVMFFIQRAGQIMDLVNAIIDGIGAIASGGISAMAQLVENALAKALPVVIGFLANLLGLGGLAKKVQAIILKVREKVDNAIDWVIEKAKKAGRWMMSKLSPSQRREMAQDEQVQDLDVKAKVRKDLTDNLKGPIKSKDDVQPIISRTYQKYQPEGLKSLELVEEPDKPGKFKIMAEASPVEEVGVVQAALGLEVADLVNVADKSRDKYTALSAFMMTGNHVENLGRHTSNDPHNDPARNTTHAEEHLLDELESMWPDNEDMEDPEYNTGVPSKTQTNVIDINLTRSPCSACAADLNRWLSQKRAEGWQVEMHINIVSIYGGARNAENEQGEQIRQPRRQDTEIALRELQAGGVRLNALDVIGLMEEEGIIDSEEAQQIDQVRLQKRIDDVRAVLRGIGEVEAG